VSRTLAGLALEEFEELVERAIDRRSEVSLTHLMDIFEVLTDDVGGWGQQAVAVPALRLGRVGGNSRA
jgi:hypothetical protein